MNEKVKSTLLKWVTGGSLTILGLTQFTQMCSDEMQEWHDKIFINRVDLTKDSLMIKINELETEIERANSTN